MTALTPTLQAWFTEHLIGQRGASPHTIAAYRDCVSLLVTHLHRPVGSNRPISTSATSTTPPSAASSPTSSINGA